MPTSGGFFEGLGCDVVHFMTQSYEFCEPATVYNPHDLQHRHMPQYFSDNQLEWREATYQAGCRTASVVCVGSRWVKNDVCDAYGVDPDKVQVIPWAPPTAAYGVPDPDDLDSALASYGLAQPFALYPAVSWPHKNHLRLIEAFAAARARLGDLRLVFTGHRSEHWTAVDTLISELGLTDRIHHLGVIPAMHLRCIYRLALFVVIPTLFEAASGPLFEAWNEGAPAAVSNVTSLPEQAQDAALLFDPTSEVAIADSLERMTNDKALRDKLTARGRVRLRDFDWSRTARAYRAVYRSAAGAHLSGDDERLLTEMGGRAV